VFQKEISQDGKMIRLIYQGKVLQDSELVSKYGLKDGVFIHAFITDQVNQPPLRREGESFIQNPDQQ
jgi:Ubiquitin family